MTYRDLDRRPRVEVDGADLGDVHAQVAVDAGAADAQEHAQVPGGPPRTCGRKNKDVDRAMKRS